MPGPDDTERVRFPARGVAAMKISGDVLCCDIIARAKSPRLGPGTRSDGTDKPWRPGRGPRQFVEVGSE